MNNKSLYLLLSIVALFTIVNCTTDSTSLYQLTTSSEPGDGGQVTPVSAEAAGGETIRIQAEENDYWIFHGWSGDYSGTEKHAEVIMDGDKHVIAQFRPIEHILSIQVDGEGDVHREIVQQKVSEHEHGTVLKLTAIPASDWQFSEWSGDAEGDALSVEIVMNEPKSVTATFAGLPLIETAAVNSIGQDSAQGGGEVISGQGSEVFQFGICWNEEGNPTKSDECTNDGSGTGSFISMMADLNPDTEYFVRAYAENSVGTAFGDEINFRTLDNAISDCGVMTDQDGNEYDTVVIGSQCWMRENIRTTTYRNGTKIPHLESNSSFVNDQSGGWMYYGNDPDNADTYGLLYNWHTVVNANGICPVDWKMPDDDDWLELAEHLGGQFEAGGKMKHEGTEFWQAPNEGATNESGFTSLPAGYRDFFDGTYGLLRSITYWWSKSEHDNNNARYWENSYQHFMLVNLETRKNQGFSVRCVAE
ncbi:MAG: hypothetical protein EA391_13690 [Balneolaceae bacterium]|nr:MAG: hypothetical protein EA391_13690 [Balneolaceae bacterium]